MDKTQELDLDFACKLCGEAFSVQMFGKGVIGVYVLHLIKEHWEFLLIIKNSE